jgi:magnesium chelatase subunit I
VAEAGEATPIAWWAREDRYSEKLSTPDISVADLIGEVDPVKVAEGRYLSDELTIHYGLIPRTNRGVFAINELPDLAEKIQVGLFNILEERDVQVRGYQIRLPLDVYVLATANPEDYTNRGRIITPLKDRYGSQIRTHYPKRIDQEIDIMEAERLQFAPDEYQVVVPQFMKEVVAEVTSLARASADINQRSGVSVRVTISNYENVLSNAMRRAIRAGEKIVAPRVSDLPYILASTSGKIELETIEDGKEDQVVEKLVRGAVNKVFNRYFEIQQFDDVITSFKNGVSVEVGDGIRSEDYVRAMRSFPSLVDPVLRLGGENPATVASAMEFILEGLHVNKKLNKDRLAGRAHYRG